MGTLIVFLLFVGVACLLIGYLFGHLAGYRAGINDAKYLPKGVDTISVVPPAPQPPPRR